MTLSIAIGPAGDLTCREELWTMVVADWSFPQQCVIENTKKFAGAMSWVGVSVPDSLNWSDYTVEMRMIV